MLPRRKHWWYKLRQRSTHATARTLKVVSGVFAVSPLYGAIYIDVNRKLLGHPHSRLPCTRTPELPNSCDSTRDSCDHVTFTASGKSMDTSREIVSITCTRSMVWLMYHFSIILDEIHTIGQQEGGAVWEQILLLAPCPVMSVSALLSHFP